MRHCSRRSGQQTKRRKIRCYFHFARSAQRVCVFARAAHLPFDDAGIPAMFPRRSKYIHALRPKRIRHRGTRAMAVVAHIVAGRVLTGHREKSTCCTSAPYSLSRDRISANVYVRRFIVRHDKPSYALVRTKCTCTIKDRKKGQQQQRKNINSRFSSRYDDDAGTRGAKRVVLLLLSLLRTYARDSNPLAAVFPANPPRRRDKNLKSE